MRLEDVGRVAGGGLRRRDFKMFCDKKYFITIAIDLVDGCILR